MLKFCASFYHTLEEPDYEPGFRPNRFRFAITRYGEQITSRTNEQKHTRRASNKKAPVILTRLLHFSLLPYSRSCKKRPIFQKSGQVANNTVCAICGILCVKNSIFHLCSKGHLRFQPSAYPTPSSKPLSEPLSEVYELFDELKDRYQSWRTQVRTRQEGPLVEPMEEAPDIEFTPLDPNASPSLPSRRTFSDLSAAWIEAQCAAGVFAQGIACFRNRRVTRVHALGGRMTGTTREQRYEDQEILLRDGELFASCSCERVSPAPNAPSSPSVGSAVTPAQPPDETPTLRCKHVVAVLLAYLQTNANAPAADTPARPPVAAPDRSDKLICPVTRQPLEIGQPLFQCLQCGMNYSAEGWKFLQQADKGRCCGCESRNTVKPAVTA